MRARLTFANVVSAAALFISLGGGAYAATSSFIRSDGTIRACVAKSGSVRVLTAKQSCKKRETPIAWNRSGPVGKTGPAGPAGAQGAAGRDGRDVDASNHYTKAESDAKYLAAAGKAADAEKLDGADSTDFAGAGDLLFARVASNGATVSGSRPASGVSAAPLGSDSSRVTFGRDVSACSFAAIEADGSPSGDTIAVASAGGGNVDVAFPITRHAFHLQVIC
jgi:hypothetical protein